jgi:hypothetical protein
MFLGFLVPDLLGDKRDGSVRTKLIRILPIRIMITDYRYIEERTGRKIDLARVVSLINPRIFPTGGAETDTRAAGVGNCREKTMQG